MVYLIVKIMTVS